MFEHTKGDPQQFVHERTDNAHLTFTGGLHALSFGSQDGVVSESNNRRKIERLAQVPIARFTKAGFGLDRTAGGKLAGAQSRISHRLRAGFKLLHRRQLSQDDRRGRCTDAINGAEQLQIGEQDWIGFNPIGDRLFQTLDALLQVFDRAFNVFEDSFVLPRISKAIALFGQIAFSAQQPAGQFLQVGLRSTRRGPERWIGFSDKLRNEHRIHAVVFVSEQFCFGIIFRAQRVKHAYSMLLGVQEAGQRVSIAARGFQGRVQLSDLQLLDLLLEQSEAHRVIGKRATALAAILQQKTTIELVFCDIDTENSFSHNNAFKFGCCDGLGTRAESQSCFKYGLSSQNAAKIQSGM